MEKKRKTAQYRERMDKTLTSPDLTNGEKIKALVRNQLICSSEHELEGCSETVLETRTVEVSNFLDMLRSASVNENEAPKVHDASQPEWKLKQDTEEYRVMYREGMQGTPFHTLLVEGYVDGPVDECLCVSWESGLYKKWWPQITIPSFKLISTQCVQKIRVGEQISLMRVKVPWPLSAREALVHYFEFEYAPDDLVVVLVNTISDVESVNVDTHGFSKDGIPKAKDVVRIEVVGGFAIQKVTPERSYFRTIARMDMKLDFVPPSLINFIARQLIGNGFRLYEKIVASALKNDDDFRKALADPMYVRIRKAFFSSDEPNVVSEQDELYSDTFSLPGEQSCGSLVQDGLEHASHEREDHESESSEKSVTPTTRKAFGEIEEEETEDDMPKPMETCTSDNGDLTDTYAEKSYGNMKFPISPKVEEALGTLDKIIYLIQKYGFNAEPIVTSGFTNAESSNLEQGEAKNSISSEEKRVQGNGEVCAEASQKEVEEKSLQELVNSSSNRYLRSSESTTQSKESNLHRIAPESPEKDLVNPYETRQIALSSSTNVTSKAPIPENIVLNQMQVYGNENDTENISLPAGGTKPRRVKHRSCCFRYNFG